jgi:probable non-F420 flavinoid oxidoreductase
VDVVAIPTVYPATQRGSRRRAVARHVEATDHIPGVNAPRGGQAWGVTTIGYHASHEQHAPSALLDAARAAADAGFGAVSSSDHLTPWSHHQGESGFAWSWLGAAMQAVPLPFGVVNAPGQRYHPVIIAQAIATLAEMHPDRLWVALGSGEASNEHVTGDPWPSKPVRNARLAECVDVIRALLRGEEVSLDGHVRVDRARLWTLPASPPPLIGAALSEETAAWCGGWADGLITVHMPPPQLRKVIDAFRGAGGEGKPVNVQVKVAWAPTEEEALAGAYEQWRTNVFDSVLMADLETVGQFEAAATHVRPEDMHRSVLVSADPKQHAAWLSETLDLGVDGLYVHQVPREQMRFIDTFGTAVLPEVAGR